MAHFFRLHPVVKATEKSRKHGRTETPNSNLTKRHPQAALPIRSKTPLSRGMPNGRGVFPLCPPSATSKNSRSPPIPFPPVRLSVPPLLRDQTPPPSFHLPQKSSKPTSRSPLLRFRVSALPRLRDKTHLRSRSASGLSFRVIRVFRVAPPDVHARSNHAQSRRRGAQNHRSRPARRHRPAFLL